MKLTAKVLLLNQANENGVIYPTEVGDKIVEGINNRPNGLLGRTGLGFCFSKTIDIERASHVSSNARIENNWVVVDIDILETPEGRNLKRIIKLDVSNIVAFRISADGVLGESNLGLRGIVQAEHFKLYHINTVFNIFNKTLSGVNYEQREGSGREPKSNPSSTNKFLWKFDPKSKSRSN